MFHFNSQKSDQKFEEKAGDHVCFNEIDQCYTDFVFLHVISFVIEGKSPVIYSRRKIVFMKPHFYLALQNFRMSGFVKTYH